MNNIDRIMYLIDWSRTPAEQAEGIQLAREVMCLKPFFRPVGPGYSKSVWDNCALIIAERSDEELIPYIPDMLSWLRDLNWPGAEIIQQRLIRFSNIYILSIHIDKLVHALTALNETSWIFFLSALLENEKLKNSLKYETVQQLESRSGKGNKGSKSPI